MGFGELVPSNRVSISLSDQVDVYIKDQESHDKAAHNRDEESTERQCLSNDSWVLSLDEPYLPHDFSRGWILGCSSDITTSGPMKVDFLLAGSRKRQSTIAPVHLIFKISSESGLLLYKSVSQDQKVEILEDGKYQEIPCNQYRAVASSLTKFRLGGLAEYDLVYHVPDLEAHLLHLRDLFYATAGVHVGHLLTFRPSGTTQIFKNTGVYLNGETLAGGAEGLVSEAYSIAGAPLAVKVFHLNGNTRASSVIHEYEIASLFRESRVVAGALRLWCEHDHTVETCSQCMKRKARHVKWYMSFELAQGNFENILRRKDVLFEHVLECFYQCLEGVLDIHSKGYIHRDISLRNLLVFSLKPCRVSITDFGKAVKHEHGNLHYETALGPTPYVAPEVWSGKGYGLSIDLYCLAICAALVFVDLPWRNNKVTSDGLRELCSLLYTYGTNQPHTADLMNLLCLILRFHVEDRLTIEQALMHVCWNSVRPVWEDVRKRPRIEEDRNRSNDNQFVEAEKTSRLTVKEGSLGTATPTQPFSDGFYSSALAPSPGQAGEANEPALAQGTADVSDSPKCSRSNMMPTI